MIGGVSRRQAHDHGDLGLSRGDHLVTVLGLPVANDST
jgi:hypothetical protein